MSRSISKSLRESKVQALQKLESLIVEEEKNNFKRPKAFTVFVYRNYISADWDEEDYTEGQSDNGIDVVNIEDFRDFAVLTLLQTKAVTSFSSNAFNKLIDGLDIFLNYSKADYARIKNRSLVDKINTFRSSREQFGVDNIKVRLIFATLADSHKLTEEDEIIQRRDQLKGKYQDIYKDFSVEVVGFREIMDRYRAKSRREKEINADLRIVSNRKQVSSFSYQSAEIKSLVCTVPGSEIARIVNLDSSGFIFDMNVRRYLGAKGSVNKEIFTTSIDAEVSHRFWFLNNGITAVCDDFTVTDDPDKPIVKIKNVQIVNGSQTAETLARAAKEERLQPNVEVLVRIYKTSDQVTIDKIVLSTNNQNKIGNRNLKANDPRQIQLEEAFKLYGYLYERKPHQFDGVQYAKNHLFSNDEVGRAVLAIQHRIPSDSRARKYKIWDELYDQVFSENPVETFIIPSLIYRQVSLLAKRDKRRNSKDEIVRAVLKKGAFHLSLMLVLKERKRFLDNNVRFVEKYIQEKKFTKDLENSVRILAQLLRSKKFRDDPDKALKSSDLDKKINH